MRWAQALLEYHSETAGIAEYSCLHVQLFDWFCDQAVSLALFPSPLCSMIQAVIWKYRWRLLILGFPIR